jgi:tRNA nucleotidyltransferase/poly(A) polymerase
MVNIPDTIQKDIDLINAVCNDLKMKLYVVGGFPRDIVAGVGITEETDLDVTEENGNAFDLAFFVSAKYGLPEPAIYENSGTAVVFMESGRQVEFHNAYYNVPHIIDELYSLGIEPTSLNKDVFSRDFTINTLLYDPIRKDIIDLTEKGVSDIQNRVLRTPLSPRKTLGLDPKRIIRGIRFKVQFDLSLDPELAEEASNFIPYVQQFLKDKPNSKMAQDTIKKTFSYNPEKAYQEFAEWDLLQFLPKIEEVDKFIRNKMFGTTVFPTSLEISAQSKMI